MEYPKGQGWTYGLELELSDCERDLPIPLGAWDKKDNTIVNSNGVANDPRGVLWKFGGEINTQPTYNIGDQVEIVDEIYRSLSPAPTVNYRSNLHVHIRVPGLSESIGAMKRIAEYSFLHSPRAFELVDPLPPKPDPESPFRTEEMVRYRRRRASHHTNLTGTQLANITAAVTPEQVRAAHAYTDAAGRPQYHLVQRCGVNLLSLWKHDTIEFRHFCGTLELEEIYSAIRWCSEFLASALFDHAHTPDDIYTLLFGNAKFPRQELISVWHERRYRQSSIRYNTAEEVREVIEQWRQEGTL